VNYSKKINAEETHTEKNPIGWEYYLGFHRNEVSCINKMTTNSCYSL